MSKSNALHQRFWLVTAMMIGAVGCNRSAAPDSSATKPAKVATPVSESQLNTIELTPEAVKRLGITTAKIESQEIQQVRPYGAEVVLPNGASVVVSAPVAGTVQSRTDKEFPLVGTKVKAQEEILSLLPLLSPERAVLTPAERIRFAEARNAVSQARIDADGQVRQAQVQVDAAKIALERAERLLREQAGTVRAVDDAQAQLNLAQKGLEAAEARKRLVDSIDLEESETGTLAPLKFNAPLAGQIRTMLVRPGEIVAATAPLFEVMDVETLWVRVSVYVGELSEIAKDEPIELSRMDGRHSKDRVLAQPIDLPPTATPLAAAVDLYYRLENASGTFSPGERLTAQLVLKGSGKHSVVPWSAVIHDIYGGQWIYEEVASGTYVRRRVEVAWVHDDLATLARGPEAGTLVVVTGAAELAGTEFGFSK